LQRGLRNGSAGSITWSRRALFGFYDPYTKRHRRMIASANGAEENIAKKIYVRVSVLHTTCIKFASGHRRAQR
jgi:hypothetical protein